MDTFPGMVLSEEKAQAYIDSGVWKTDTFVDVMERNADKFGSLVHRDDTTTLSYEALWNEAGAVAAHLNKLGIQKGDKVALLLPTSLDFLVALFGVTRLGAVAVILQADLGRQDVKDSLAQSQASVLIVAQHHQGHALADDALALVPELPHLRAALIADERTEAYAERSAMETTHGTAFPVDSFSACRQSGQVLPEEVAAQNRPTPLDMFVMVFTAGTTGSPKGIVHLHGSALWSARTYAGLYGMSDGGATLSLAPVYHLTGFLVGIMMPVVTGSRILLQSRFAVSRALTLIDEEQPDYIVGAPPHLIHFSKAPTLKELKLSSVKMFFYAGAPVPSDILRQLQADTGWTVGALFGWSEGFLATATRRDDPVEIINQTVGQAIPGMELMLVDDDGKPVNQGEIGEMWGRGPSFSAGYYNLASAAREKWDNDGWFHSGDLLRQNPDGRYVYKGRRDNIINRGGTKIDPREVEAAIAKHPAVQTTVVVPVPDATLGQKTLAAVVCKPDVPVFSLKELRQFLTETGLANYELPDGLQFFEAPPAQNSEQPPFGPGELRTMVKSTLNDR